MKVRIADLPEDVSKEDLRGLLEESQDIKHIELVAENDTDQPIAIVELASDAAGEAVIQVLNGRNWKGSTLRADKLLY